VETPINLFPLLQRSFEYGTIFNFVLLYCSILEYKKMGTF